METVFKDVENKTASWKAIWDGTQSRRAALKVGLVGLLAETEVEGKVYGMGRDRGYSPSGTSKLK